MSENGFHAFLGGSPDLLARGDALAAAGRLPLAEAAWRQALALDPTLAAVEARLAMAKGADDRPREALAAWRRASLLEPDTASHLEQWGWALERLGEVEAAIGVYRQAQRRVPGYAGPWSRLTALNLRRALGPPKPRRARSEGPRITMTTLGRNGRFGNQLLQYAHLRAFAEIHGLALEAPDWIGRDLFGLDDPPPRPDLAWRAVAEDDVDLAWALAEPRPRVFADVDLLGYFCGSTAPLARLKGALRGWFGWTPAVEALLAPALNVPARRGSSLIALHLRRGDFGGANWIAPVDWYRAWLAEIWGAFPDPVLYVATDEPALVGAFAEYRPLHAGDPALQAGAPPGTAPPGTAPPGTAPPGTAVVEAEFLVDFAMLARADALAISNSTFSFAASLLNARCRAPFRPDRRRGTLMPYDPWAAPALLP